MSTPQEDVSERLAVARQFDEFDFQDPSIQFEIELPGEDGFLPFLNTKIKVNDSGTIETGWYTKPANKGLILPPRRSQESYHY